MKAYVLMQTEPAKVREIAAKVVGRGAEGAKCVTAEVVTGPYDIICICDGPTLQAISACVLDCCGVQGVQRTTTCAVP
ncbi:MAG: Lrp/AsnC family transcriptional regulator [Candidatus Bathyarchaeia archaeon]